MEHNKLPGRDGFPVELYYVFWDLIKKDLTALFSDFNAGNLPLYSLNFGTIILLLNCLEATKIQQYRLICLLNVSFKTFTNVDPNQITMVPYKVISLHRQHFYRDATSWKNGDYT